MAAPQTEVGAAERDTLKMDTPKFSFRQCDYEETESRQGLPQGVWPEPLGGGVAIYRKKDFGKSRFGGNQDFAFKAEDVIKHPNDTVKEAVGNGDRFLC